jgi:hypothetical protein
MHVSATGATLAVSNMIGGDLANLAGPFGKAGGKTEQDFCQTAIETAKRGGKEPPKKEKGEVKKALEGVQGAAEGAKDALKKLFGR